MKLSFFKVALKNKISNYNPVSFIDLAHNTFTLSPHSPNT